MSDQLPHPRTGLPFVSPVPPGTGWPEDVATPATPVAADSTAVAALAAAAQAPGGGGLGELTAASSVCRACPRLVEWREDVAVAKRRAFADQPYWGRPIPGWGDDEPWLLVLGLAPAAHGGNRTGRIFTGDRSGDWIFAALHRAGLAAQSSSVDAADGQRLIGARMVAAVRCAPPDNKPLPTERDACAGWLDAELRLTAPSVRVVLALGGFAWDAALRAGRRLDRAVDVPAARFGHGAVTRLGDVPLVGCYHVSQQNTFTGRLTEAMLDDVLGLCRRLGHIGL